MKAIKDVVQFRSRGRDSPMSLFSKAWPLMNRATENESCKTKWRIAGDVPNRCAPKVIGESGMGVDGV